LFNEFGIALAGAVVVSSFVALTLTPMLSARILRVPSSHGRIFNAFERAFQGIASAYSGTLRFAVRHRAFVVLGAGAVAGLAVILFNGLSREFLPPEDRGFIFGATQGPEGASLEYMDSAKSTESRPCSASWGATASRRP
jgi:multidrug efflux pump